MKKLLLLTLIISALILTSCSKAKPKTDDKKNNDTKAKETITQTQETNNITDTGEITNTEELEKIFGTGSDSNTDKDATTQKTSEGDTAIATGDTDNGDPINGDTNNGDSVDNNGTDSLIKEAEDLDNSKTYTTIKEAAASINVPDLTSKFSEYTIENVYVLNKDTLVIRVKYSNSYFDFRVKKGAGKDISDDNTTYAFSKVEPIETLNTEVTLKGNAEDAYYLATWSDNDYSYALIIGEPFDWFEINLIITE